MKVDKYQTEVSTSPSAANRTSAVLKEHLVVVCLRFFAYALKVACTCNPAALGAEFRNRVGRYQLGVTVLRQVGGFCDHL